MAAEIKQHLLGFKFSETEKKAMEWLVNHERSSYNSYQGVLREALFQHYNAQKALYDLEQIEKICSHCKQQICVDNNDNYCPKCGKKLSK
jgi:uncharacterized paraquat-inducible protein A